MAEDGCFFFYDCKIVQRKYTDYFRYISGSHIILFCVPLQNDFWGTDRKGRQKEQTEGDGKNGLGRMDQKECFRHELKYGIGYPQYLELRSRLRAVMQPDFHTGVDGRYLIRSIYFDNYQDKALREKTDGVPRREKFRIRYYNDDFSFIVLEKKVKDNNLCMKYDVEIAEEECRCLLDGGLHWMRGHPSALVQELYTKMHFQMLRPKVLVSYIREPYIYRAGNVRVTFDSDIRTTLYHRTFLEMQVSDISAFDQPRDMVLEVKYDAFLPEVIQNMIQTGTMRQQAFSKYAACRRFG